MNAFFSRLDSLGTVFEWLYSRSRDVIAKPQDICRLYAASTQAPGVILGLSLLLLFNILYHRANHFKPASDQGAGVSGLSSENETCASEQELTFPPPRAQISMCGAICDQVSGQHSSNTRVSAIDEPPAKVRYDAREFAAITVSTPVYGPSASTSNSETAFGPVVEEAVVVWPQDSEPAVEQPRVDAYNTTSNVIVERLLTDTDISNDVEMINDNVRHVAESVVDVGACDLVASSRSGFVQRPSENLLKSPPHVETLNSAEIERPKPATMLNGQWGPTDIPQHGEQRTSAPTYDSKTSSKEVIRQQSLRNATSYNLRSDPPSVIGDVLRTVDATGSPPIESAPEAPPPLRGKRVLVSPGRRRRFNFSRSFKEALTIPDAEFTDEEIKINETFIQTLDANKLAVLSHFGCRLPLLTSDLVSIRFVGDNNSCPKPYICIIGLESLDDIKKFDKKMLVEENMKQPLGLCYSQETIIYSAFSDVHPNTDCKATESSFDRESAYVSLASRTHITEAYQDITYHSRESDGSSAASYANFIEMRRNTTYCGSVLNLNPPNGPSRISTVGGLIAFRNKTYAITTKHNSEEGGPREPIQGTSSILLHSEEFVPCADDWLLALIHPKDRHLNIVVENSHPSDGDSGQQRIVKNYHRFDSPIFSGSREVLVNAGISGLRHGLLSKRRSFILSWTRNLQEVWAIDLGSENFQAGDSGSWVIHQSDALLFGILVSRSPGRGYMVSFERVREGIETSLGLSIGEVDLLQSRHLSYPQRPTARNEAKDFSEDEDCIVLDPVSALGHDQAPKHMPAGMTDRKTNHRQITERALETTSRPNQQSTTGHSLVSLMGRLTTDNIDLHNKVQPPDTMTTYEWVHGRRDIYPGGTTVRDVGSRESTIVRKDASGRRSDLTTPIEDEYSMVSHPSESLVACAGDWADVAALPASFDKTLRI